MPLCAKCKQPVTIGDPFCKNCGRKLSKTPISKEEKKNNIFSTTTILLIIFLITRIFYVLTFFGLTSSILRIDMILHSPSLTLMSIAAGMEIIVGFIYLISLIGIFLKEKWGLILIIVVSLIEALISLIKFASYGFGLSIFTWDIILIILAYLEYRSIKKKV